MRDVGAEELENEQKAKCRNAMQMSALILGQPLQQRKGRIVLVLTSAIKHAFSKELAGFDSPKLTFQFYLSFARDGYHLVLKKTFALLFKPDALERMMFELEGASSASSSAAGPAMVFRPVGLLPCDEVEGKMAALAWSFACALVKHLALSMLSYLQLPPGIFALLLSRSK